MADNRNRPDNHRGGGAEPSTGPVTVSRQAMDQLHELLGRRPEAVSGLSGGPDGWRLQVEVLELARTPDSTSVLASYQVDTDPDGTVRSYHRLRRYTRNQAGEL